MSKRYLNSLLVAVFLLMAGRAAATESRSQALLYNMAFPTQTDIFMYPQQLPSYEGAYFHLPAAGNNIYGGLVLGTDNHTFAIFVHRPNISNFDQYRIVTTDAVSALTLSLPGSPAVGAQPNFAGQVFDLMYGNGKWGLNFRAHLWSDDGTQEAVLADPGDPTRALTLEANLGLKLSEAMHGRVGVMVRWLQETGTVIRLSTTGRYIEQTDGEFRKVMTGELQLALQDPDGGDMSFALGIPFKGGVQYVPLPNRLTLGLLLGVDLQLFDNAGADTDFGIAIPTVEIATEWTPLDWLAIRAGVRAGYGMQLANGSGEEPVGFEQLAFSSGVGFWVNPFRLDAVVQYQLWQQGPWFVGGTPGLFAGVTASYEWGHDEPTPPPPAATPTVAPTAAPEEPVSDAMPAPGDQLTTFNL